MPESNPALTQTFISPQSFEALSQELELIATSPPGSRTVAEAISELLPLIRSCRQRGHTWEAITKVFQGRIPNLTTTAFRKSVLELDPSLKGSAAKKSVPETETSSVSPNDDSSTPAAKALAEISSNGNGNSNGKKTEPTSVQPKTQTRRKAAIPRAKKPKNG